MLWEFGGSTRKNVNVQVLGTGAIENVKKPMLTDKIEYQMFLFLETIIIFVTYNRIGGNEIFRDKIFR